jgi:hypothetical protein
VNVAVAVFSTAMVFTGWDVAVASTCSIGADVDVAGPAQADRKMINVNNNETILFMIPLLTVNKGTVQTLPLGHRQQ